MVLDEIWEYITEFFSGIGEFFSSIFDNIGEFSMMGLICGVLAAGLILLLETTPYGTLSAFTKFMSPLQKWFWTILTLVMCFVAGYFIGKHFENS